MNVRLFTLLLMFWAWHASASAPKVAYFVVKNETGMEITDLKVTARYASKWSPKIGVDWNQEFHIGRLEYQQPSEQYTAQYNYGTGHTGQNYWYIRAEFANGTGIAKEWDNDQPQEKWKQCSFLESDEKQTLTIILKEDRKVKYEMPNSSDCDDKLNVYHPVSQREKLYSIAHMANTPHAISWAKKHKANAVEADLRFTSNGTPMEFRHGTPSDCTATLNTKSSICSAVKDTDVGQIPEMFESLRQNGISLFIIDTKVQEWDTPQLEKAGRQVAYLVLEELFAKGYQGRVIISVPKAKSVAYLRVASQIIQESEYKDRVFYSIDQEGDSFEQVHTALLTLSSPQIAFGTGISNMIPGTYYQGIKDAVEARDKGEIKFVYIWTLDKKSSMMKYLELNVDGVMTNRPGVLTEVIQSNTTLPGYTPSYPEMATIDDPIPYEGSKNAADIQLSSN